MRTQLFFVCHQLWHSFKITCYTSQSFQITKKLLVVSARVRVIKSYESSTKRWYSLCLFLCAHTLFTHWPQDTAAELTSRPAIVDSRLRSPLLLLLLRQPHDGSARAAQPCMLRGSKCVSDDDVDAVCEEPRLLCVRSHIR